MELAATPTKHNAQESLDTTSSLHTDMNTPNLSSTDTTLDVRHSISSIETKHTELSLIEQRRLQQVASTGQLRPRRPPSSEEPFDPHLLAFHAQLPEIRVEPVADYLEEHDLGSGRPESDSFSFIHGQEDTIDVMDFASNEVLDTQGTSRSKRVTWLERPSFTRARTDGVFSEARPHYLLRTITDQPKSSSIMSSHPLRRVKKGLLRPEGALQGEPGYGAGRPYMQHGEASALPRARKKLQKKQGDKASKTYLRNVFSSAAGRGDHSEV